jgi:hypothetical protein
MRKIILCITAAAALAVPAAAMADSTVSTDFETFSLGSVDSQQGWHSAVPGDVPALPNGYDQAVVGTAVPGFGSQALRHSNAYNESTGEFEFQTYSASNREDAGEDLINKVFTGEFDFYGASEQPGLMMKLSPDDGHGGRMSYLRLNDEAGGIRATFFDTDADGEFHGYDAGLYAYGQVHHVKFSIQLVDGKDNDIVRLFIDNKDIGDSLGQCFTTWENYYRHVEGEEPPVTNSIEFRADGGEVPSVLGKGYLFDNVRTTTGTIGGPAPTKCGVQGAFCSTGYWKNAPGSAWEKTGVLKTALFNSVVSPEFYANQITPTSTTLIDVLTAKNANKFGKAAGPFGLNPYNAVGAALTSKLPGYVFDPAAVGSLTDTCPLDGNGNWKPGAAPTS